jgi:hypothetical protein
MLIMRPSTPDGLEAVLEAVDRARSTVKDLQRHDQEAAAAWTAEAVLSALRERRKDTPGVRTYFDRPREEAPADRARQIEAAPVQQGVLRQKSACRSLRKPSK